MKTKTKTQISIAVVIVAIMMTTQVAFAQSSLFVSALWRRVGNAVIVSPTSARLGIGTTTPSTQLHVTSASTNATTTVTIGKAGQTKGTCLELYRADGSAIYASVAAGATAFTLTTTSCK